VSLVTQKDVAKLADPNTHIGFDYPAHFAGIWGS
jgi:hypothetical protein